MKIKRRRSAMDGPFETGAASESPLFRMGDENLPEPLEPSATAAAAEGLTQLFRRAYTGDAQAVDEVFNITYGQLRTLARARLRSAGGNSLLNTGCLVNEFYLRFAGSDCSQISNREHFFRYASRAMRSVIVDSVRRRRAVRRGCGGTPVTLTTGVAPHSASGENEILMVHGAIDKLAMFAPRMAEVVELRYFAGLSEAEIAASLQVTERTVRRDWEKARLLLFEALK